MTRMPFTLLTGGAIAVAAACLTTPAVAQSDPAQPVNNGSAAASMTVPPGQVAAGNDAGTQSLNAGVNGNIQATQAVNAANQAQYQSDLDAYDRAIVHHGQQISRQDAHYAHQQRAYAEAMEAWRMQVAACKRGHTVACNAPPPDPANFY